jgi:hypothetical protein
MLTATTGLGLMGFTQAYRGGRRHRDRRAALSVDWIWRSRGRVSLLHAAVGLGPETPCKLAAAPEAIPLSPRLFSGTSATEWLSLP